LRFKELADGTPPHSPPPSRSACPFCSIGLSLYFLTPIRGGYGQREYKKKRKQQVAVEKARSAPARHKKYVRALLFFTLCFLSYVFAFLGKRRS
jgi:hypothetical protein